MLTNNLSCQLSRQRNKLTTSDSSAEEQYTLLKFPTGTRTLPYMHTSSEAQFVPKVQQMVGHLGAAKTASKQLKSCLWSQPSCPAALVEQRAALTDLYSHYHRHWLAAPDIPTFQSSHQLGTSLGKLRVPAPSVLQKVQ